MRRARFALCIVILALAITSAVNAEASGSAGDAESRLAFLQNRDRTAFGRPALQFSTFLSSVAREHAQNMAAANNIWHDPALPYVVAEWEHVGDNVGRSTDVDSLHAGFMASAEHRDNLMFRGYEQYGVGAAIAPDGRVYASVVFFTPYVAPRTARDAQSVAVQASAAQAAAQVQPQTIEMLEAVLALDADVT